MKLEEEIIEDIIIVKPPVKRIDSAVAQKFKELLLKAVGDGSKKLILDLSAVEFIDSRGLGTLVAALKATGSTGVLILCQIREPVMGLFKLTRTDQIFTIMDSREIAVESLKQ